MATRRTWFQDWRCGAGLSIDFCGYWQRHAASAHLPPLFPKSISEVAKPCADASADHRSDYRHQKQR